MARAARTPRAGATLDARTVLQNTATEKQFQEAVVELAKATGWLVYHTFDSRRSTEGFPDLVLVKDGFVWFLELKKAGKEPEPAQWRWQDAIRPATRVTASWAQPAQWDAIADVLVYGVARAWRYEPEDGALAQPTPGTEAGA